ncbi:MAG: hypothetical protein GYA21_08315 [Myxococcales bacterium]|nr:hypothetical protein [Myxococcales bacterium]
MRHFSFALLPVLAMGFAACGGGGGGGDAGTDDGDGGPTLCDQAHPCPTGQRCTKDQRCLSAEELRITTETLPDGRVGFGYNQQVEAAGGLPPYRFSIKDRDPSLAALTISESGRITGTVSQPVSGAAITVEVADDGFDGGEKASRAFTLSFTPCRDGDVELCYVPGGDGACHQGSRTCQNGVMGECMPGADLSSDRRHCGPACAACDTVLSDGCIAGLCACGGGSPCSDGRNCCSGECREISSDTKNCGGCGNDCALRVAHVQTAEIFCNAASCDYGGDCDHGFLDCNGRRDDGCELAVTLSNCGECALDCNTQLSHVSASQRQCRDTGTGFVCDYTSCQPDFGDCNGDRSDGCDTWLNQDAHCGACDTDCAAASAGHLCLTLDNAHPYDHTCGCRKDTASGTSLGCDGADICCANVCTASAANAQNCGVCGAACAAGDCQSGACACQSDGDCPKPSGATACGPQNRCVCPDYHSSVCPVGRYCCDGNAGGSGGPEENPDIGCCPKPCGQNSKDTPCQG